jgi:hypothetical protein
MQNVRTDSSATPFPLLLYFTLLGQILFSVWTGDVLFAFGEGQGGPSIEKIVWYMLDRAVLMSTKSGP